jgi:hypothetical protein
MRHEMVNDDLPVRKSWLFHLEEGRIQQKIKGFFPPRFSRINIFRDARQEM